MWLFAHTRRYAAQRFYCVLLTFMLNQCQQKITGKVERGTIGVQRITCPYCDCKIDCVHDTRSNNDMEPKEDPGIKEDRAAAQQTLVDIDSGLLDEVLCLHVLFSSVTEWCSATNEYNGILHL